MKKIFHDVIELIDYTIEALMKDYELENLSTLYNQYQYLIKAYESGIHLKNGTFSSDMQSDTYQNTTSFKSPLDKWCYFAKKDLKRLNGDLLKFVKSFWNIPFPLRSDERNFLYCNLGWYSNVILLNEENEHDNKIEFNQDCSVVIYDYMVFWSNQSGSKLKNSRRDLCKTIKFEPSVISENLDLLLKKFKLYKEFLEAYFQVHLCAEKLFLEFDKRLR